MVVCVVYFPDETDIQCSERSLIKGLNIGTELWNNNTSYFTMQTMIITEDLRLVDHTYVLSADFLT